MDVARLCSLLDGRCKDYINSVIGRAAVLDCKIVNARSELTRSSKMGGPANGEG